MKLSFFQRRRQPNYAVNGEKMVRLPNGSDPPTVRSLWTPTYKLSKQYYADNKAPDPEMEARNCAWRAVDVYMRNPGRAGWIDNGPVQWKDSQVIDDPGKVTVIGKLMEVTYLSANMTFDVEKFKEPGLPDLIWDDKHKRILCYPTLPKGTFHDDVSKVADENKMYKRWHKRDAGAYEVVKAKSIEVLVIGAADAIVYRSDKWDEPNPDPDLAGSPEYLHQHDLGVFTSRNPGSATNLLVVQGAKLDALTAGIIH